MSSKNIFIILSIILCQVSYSNTILLMDDFEDENISSKDSNLINGTSWIVIEGAAKNFKAINGTAVGLTRDTGQKINSTIILAEPIVSNNYTISFKSQILYSQDTRFLFLYLNEDNYYIYSVSGIENGLYKLQDGKRIKLKPHTYLRTYKVPRSNTNIDIFKINILIYNTKLKIYIDRNGYGNGLDYEVYYEENLSNTYVKKTEYYKFGFQDYSKDDFDHYVNPWTFIDDVYIYEGKINDLRPHENINIWVDYINGNDTYTGSASSPFKTLSKAISYSLPGDKIIVKNGFVNESVEFSKYKIYGIKNNPLTIISENKYGSSIREITINADYIILKDFNFTYPFSKALVIEGDNVIVDDNYINGMHSTAINCVGDNNIIKNNYITRVQKGININGNNWIVENNTVYYLIEYIVGIDSDYSRFSGSNGIFKYNKFYGLNHSEMTTAHVDCFQTFDNNGGYAINISFYNNLCVGCAQGVRAEGSNYHNSSNFTFINNIFDIRGAWGLSIDNIEGIYVYNNLFANAIYGIGTDKNSTGISENNIFYNIKIPYHSSSIGKNNWIYSESKTFEKYEYVYDYKNIDPLIELNNNYKLSNQSPLIDKGLYLSFVRTDFGGLIRPQGGGYDIGPYEYTPTCTTSSDCPDRDCNSKNCVSGICKYTPVSDMNICPDDGNECTYDYCISGVCSHINKEDGLSCRTDGYSCTYNHMCISGKCVGNSYNDSACSGFLFSDNASCSNKGCKYIDINNELLIFLNAEDNSNDITVYNLANNSFKVFCNYNRTCPQIIKHISYDNSSAYYFDGINDYIKVLTEDVEGITEGTIAFWLKPNMTDLRTITIMGSYSADTPYSWVIGNYYNRYNVLLYLNSTLKRNLYFYLGSNAYKSNVWRHYVITFNSTHLAIYINGVMKDIVNRPKDFKMMRYINRIVIGSDTVFDRFYKGYMDNIVIMNRSLNKWEINALYNYKYNAGYGYYSKDCPLDINIDGWINYDDYDYAYNKWMNNRISIKKMFKFLKNMKNH